MDPKKSARRIYLKPEVSRIALDNSISLVMMSGPSDPPPPPMGTNPSKSEPFSSPFQNKPFG